MRNLRTEKEIMSNWQGDSSKPVVSICCITYNHEPYIEDALEGFLIQETEFPFEIIVHDDASTDKTAEIIREYVAAYPNIIKPILQKENQYSRRGFSFISEVFDKCVGKYVALCEGDDYWIKSDKISKQVSFLEINPNYFLCIHNASIKNALDDSESLFNKFKLSPTLCEYDVILRRWFSPTASFLFRKLKLDSEISKSINGDMLILFKCATLGKIYYDHSVMSVYRLFSKDSLTSTTHYRELYKKKISFYFYCLKRSNLFIAPVIFYQIIFTYAKSLIPRKEK